MYNFIDSNEIIAKTDGTTETTLHLSAGAGVNIYGPALLSGTLQTNGAAKFVSTVTTLGYIYQQRNVGSTAYIMFKRAANHATTITTNSGAYTHTLKANGEAELAQIYFTPSYASSRKTEADGTVNSSYVFKI